MEFVKVGRNELIKQLKEYIDLLKKCPKDMEFHTLVSFCGIDKKFLDISRTYNATKMLENAKEQKRLKEEEGNI